MKHMIAKRLRVCDGSNAYGKTRIELNETMTIQVPSNETPFFNMDLPLNETLFSAADTVGRDTFYRWMKHVSEPIYRRLKHILTPQVIDFAGNFVAVICFYYFLTTSVSCH